jgi:hydrogenase expression/formation protein HypC
MCLAVPMKLVELKEGQLGIAELDGVRCEVNFSLLEHVELGDYLIVHAGFAIEKLNEEEALKQLELLRAIEV